ncbi:hypothetical protein DFH08DRAFT_938325 [Mycena albidolilacea]|uniref:Uncharacterized protein n=1 Tax=Mycena albidolilacea TaxID=1033008 RepID=A0AAD6ZVE1_9AGAR|nr:hypothetical protein DFH08DRAFT_938325 [Mycena albidolilacea]
MGPIQSLDNQIKIGGLWLRVRINLHSKSIQCSHSLALLNRCVTYLKPTVGPKRSDSPSSPLFLSFLSYPISFHSCPRGTSWALSSAGGILPLCFEDFALPTMNSRARRMYRLWIQTACVCWGRCPNSMPHSRAVPGRHTFLLIISKLGLDKTGWKNGTCELEYVCRWLKVPATDSATCTQPTKEELCDVSRTSRMFGNSRLDIMMGKTLIRRATAISWILIVNAKSLEAPWDHFRTGPTIIHQSWSDTQPLKHRTPDSIAPTEDHLYRQRQSTLNDEDTPGPAYTTDPQDQSRNEATNSSHNENFPLTAPMCFPLFSVHSADPDRTTTPPSGALTLVLNRQYHRTVGAEISPSSANTSTVTVTTIPGLSVFIVLGYFLLTRGFSSCPSAEKHKCTLAVIPAEIYRCGENILFCSSS